MDWPCGQNPGRSPKAANAFHARGDEPRRTEFDLQGQHLVRGLPRNRLSGLSRLGPDGKVEPSLGFRRVSAESAGARVLLLGVRGVEFGDD
jgi:hypothetical protein